MQSSVFVVVVGSLTMCSLREGRDGRGVLSSLQAAREDLFTDTVHLFWSHGHPPPTAQLAFISARVYTCSIPSLPEPRFGVLCFLGGT